MKLSQKFIDASAVKAFDIEHRRKINYNIEKYDHSVSKGKLKYQKLDLARERANYLKWKAIENLDTYLLQFEKQFNENGGKVIWAEDGAQAIKEIIKIFNRVQARSTVKSKSMVTEEIHLNEHLEKSGVEVFETDLGEYIVQLRNEPPYHIVTPAMHLSKEDVAQTFHEKLGTPLNFTPEQLTAEARKILRTKYLEAEIGITGANFIIADTGSIALTENEGNARLSFSYPKVHIVIAGIEKVIPSLTDLDLFWPLLGVHGTGQFVTVYNSVVSGPRQNKETDGPDEMIVILLDNGRTNVLAEPDQRQSLYCIRCGACLNACPVYKNIGGHSYNTTYAGPIGSVITPHMKDLGEYKHLSYASSLCGNCTEVCPVRIDLHKLLLFNRKESVDKHFVTKVEKWAWYFWRKGMSNRKILNMAGLKSKQFMLNYFVKDLWGDKRSLPQIAPKSFNQLWQEQHKPDQQ